mmetsp:Transcript_53833/g.131606  ORF Transcript_53833/g.131606 Transcript_53833/m.131606 type:complete len:109 (+) Transcript_53833:41-367(+)
MSAREKPVRVLEQKEIVWGKETGDQVKEVFPAHGNIEISKNPKDPKELLLTQFGPGVVVSQVPLSKLTEIGRQRMLLRADQIHAARERMEEERRKREEEAASRSSSTA